MSVKKAKFSIMSYSTCPASQISNSLMFLDRLLTFGKIQDGAQKMAAILNNVTGCQQCGNP